MKRTPPKVSICVPIYNVEKYVSRCLDSLINQTLRDIEIIIVNDATPDNSMEVVRKYAGRDSRIQIIDNVQNRGLMSTRRVGYMAATGEYLIFVDSDDWIPENAIEILYNRAVETDADLVSGSMQKVDSNGIYGLPVSSRMEHGNGKIGLFKAVLTRGIIQNIWAKLYRRALWQEFEYITIEHCTQAEDAGALFQYIDHCESFAIVDEVVYFYFTNPASASFNITLHSYEDICKNTIIRENVLRKYPELDDERNRYFTNNLYMGRIRKDAYEILRRNGLQEYASLKFIWRYVSAVEKIKFAAKWLLRPIKQY